MTEDTPTTDAVGSRTGTTDRPTKRQRLRSVLADRGPDARLVLTSAEMLAWYLDGARVAVSLAGQPVLAAAVSLEGETIYCFDNEVERMLDEELPEDIDVVPVPWHRPLAEAVGPASTEPELAEELRVARASLLPLELSRYRALCRETAAILTDVLVGATPSHTERELAAGVAERVVAAGADPLVVLAAGSSRLSYRHPLPTHAPLGRRAMVVVCARRHGMIANVTRWVSFGTRSAAERATEAAILDVEAAVLDATRPGKGLDEPFSALVSAYPRFGFDTDEWQRHHQGGPTGYFGRDPRATPDTRRTIVDGQAFAWNPTAPGAKVEDTVLVTHGGIEVLTVDPRWPSVERSGRRRPIELELG